MALRSAAAAAPRSLRRLITGTSARTLPIFLQAIHDCEKPTPPNTNAFVSGRLFSSASTSSFIPPPLPPSAQQREQPEPSTNLFVSGLSKRTTTEKLNEAFAKFGEVVHARVVTDRVTGYSKGFGFVKYATLEDAAKGIEGMDGKFLDGWVIFAEYARPRPPPEHNAVPPYGRQ
ncbi:organelle RRM domain-containing protein 2, mitochondrial-like [Cucurbita pepo subsp. pepo]|uniref:organelle RRM domain-containing protein 2, mitochondrial-like n=1 Tax=Cucurbita pepo subsp. pepo TaxID=3664 RepID=UPI000C9D7319|nr:organelle RRM domain-containing protein 2, mitochondrial-like [Cucurbita pepo subsp. pepo]